MFNNTAAASSTYVNGTVKISRKGKGWLFMERNLTMHYLYQKLANGIGTEKLN